MKIFPEVTPRERPALTFRFGDEAGDAVFAPGDVTVTVALASGVDPSPNLTKIGGFQIQGKDVLQLVGDLIDGNDYRYTCLAILSDGRRLERIGVLPVRDA